MTGVAIGADNGGLPEQRTACGGWRFGPSDGWRQGLAALWLAVMALLFGDLPARAAEQTVVFGPTSFQRQGGSPDQYTATFSLSSQATAPYVLRIVNGNANGQQRVSSATITLNGVTVAGPSDFNKNVAQFDRSVSLQTSNTLQVTLASAPDSLLTVSVLGAKILPVPTGLSPNPLAITAGANGNLTAALAPAPPAAGSLDVASSDATIASVPATVAFDAGQAAVSIPITGGVPGTATVVASLNGVNASSTVQVTPRPPTLVSLLPSTLALNQGATGALNATISAAQPRDTALALSASAGGVAYVPASVTVPAGQTSAPVPVTALYPGSTGVTASLNGSSAASQVTTVAAPAALVSLLPAASQVAPGAVAQLEVTLSSAPSAPATVTLTATPPDPINLPASVTVAAGQMQARVPVQAVAVGQSSVAASYSGGSATAVVQVTPAVPRVASLSPAVFAFVPGATGQFTVALNAVQAGNTEIALAVDRPDLVQVPASVTVAQGATQAMFTVTALAPGNAVLTATVNGVPVMAALQVVQAPVALASFLPNPLALQVGATGLLSATLNAAQANDLPIAVANGSTSLLQAPASLVIPAGRLSAPLPVAALAPGVAPVTLSVNGTSATAMVNITSASPMVGALTPSPLTLPKGTPGTLRVTASGTSNVPITIQLTSENPGIAAVPASVTLPAGALFADFPVATVAPGQAKITASLGGSAVAATVVVAPAEPVALSLAPQSPVIYVGDGPLVFTVAATMTDGSTQDVTQQVAWSTSDSAIATLSAGGTATAVAAGTTSIAATFAFTDSLGVARTLKQNTALTVKPPVSLALSAPTTRLAVGQSVTVTVTAGEPAGASGLTVSLSAAGGLSVPASVVIPAAQTSASFTATGTAEGAATLSASAPAHAPGSLGFTVLLDYGITGLDPASGPVGVPVTIAGLNFDPDPAKNEVRFNGVPAIVGSATASQLRVIVPIKATTGPVTVTTARGTATSPVPYTVQPLQGFDLAVAPATVQLPRTGQATARVHLVNLGLSPYTQGVALQVGGLPAGVTASFSPPQLSAGADTILTLTANGTAAAGSYALTVTGTGPLDVGTATRGQPLALTVLDATATTLSGRVLHAEDDTPFVGARIRLGTQQTMTDETGAYRFVNPGVLGDQVLLVDGSTAATATTQFPSAIAVPVMVMANQDNRALTSYIQAVDATQFQAIVPGQATAVTNPDLPNYALNIPQGAVLMGWDGTPVTKVNVRAVPADKLPIKPIPAGVNAKTVYLYYFFREGGANPSTPIPVTMANDMGALPGEKADLWYYDESTTPDPNSNQWRIMGQGTVSDDGLSIVSDPGVGIPKFCCGASFASPPPQPKPPATCPDDDPGENPGSPNPIYFGTGVATVMGDHSLGINGLFPVRLSCRYNSASDRIGPFGRGTWLNTEWQVAVGSLALTLMSPAGHRYNLAKGSDGVYRATPGPTGADGVEATIGSNGHTQVRFPDGTVYEFASFGRGNQGLVAQTDPHGNRVTLTRTSVGAAQGILQSVTDANGRVFQIQGNGTLINKIIDPIGRTLSFTYDGNTRLTQVTDAAGNTTSYAYDALNRIVQKTDSRGAVTTYAYDANGLANQERFADGATWNMSYSLAGNQIMETRATDANGNVTTYRFNGIGNLVRMTDPLGGIRLKNRDFATNRVMSEVDPLGRITRYTYDAKGNRTSVKDAVGNVTLIDYDPLFNKPTAITDALGNKTIRSYDGQGNLVAMTNGEGQTTRVTYTAQGKPQSVTDPLGRVRTFSYDTAGNLVRAADPLGNAIDYGYDSANRRVSTTTPKGETSLVAYDALDRVTQMTDPLGGITALTYDPNGNRLTVTDPLGHIVETNAYDLRNRLIQRTDAAGQKRTFQYDGNGNLTQATDRAGRTITYTYDALNRVSQVLDADGRRTSYFYDLASNLVRVSDSASGDILLTYDTLNRVTRVATDQGTVGYAYDAIGRLTQRTINGGDPSDYSYDRANRVTSIAFRGKTASYNYDAAGRLARKTLPNGLVQAYQYDDADQLTQLQVQKPDGTPVETLQYVYDADGQRLQKASGSDSLRETGFAAQYDAANRLTQITFNPGTANPKTYQLTYDRNGSLVGKVNVADPADATTYVWDARNRLVGIQGPNLQASFGYDALGRRIGRTVNGQSTAYLYDGQQAIAELAGNAVTAAYHTGVGLDEVLARYAGAGNRTLLTDALGSVIAQAGDDGTVQNWYAYTPYGEVQAIGPDAGNPLQYTGRENDGSGLYYYRARYYDPQLKHFISEDPIGLAGGINQYAYVGANPISYVDPKGLDPLSPNNRDRPSQPPDRERSQEGRQTGNQGASTPSDVEICIAVCTNRENQNRLQKTALMCGVITTAATIGGALSGGPPGAAAGFSAGSGLSAGLLAGTVQGISDTCRRECW